MNSKYDTEVIRELFQLKEAGVSHRKIAKKLFGKKTMCSTVSMLLDRCGYYKNINKLSEQVLPEVSKGISKEDFPNILITDIETAPAISYHWGRWKVNVGTTQVIQRPYLISWASNWFGKSDTIESDCIAYYEDFEKDPTNDRYICQSIWNMLDKADIVVAHYGKKFDIPQLNTRFVTNGLGPPSPYVVVDTKEIASRFFKFEGNSLKELADHLNVEDNKLDMTFTDWRNCVEGVGSPEAWDLMVRYNERDVVTLRYVYLKIRAYASNHPNISTRLPDNLTNEIRCTVCASNDFKKLDNNAYTMVSMFESYRCNNCGHTNRSRTNLRSSVQMKNTLQNII